MSTACSGDVGEAAPRAPPDASSVPGEGRRIGSIAGGDVPGDDVFGGDEPLGGELPAVGDTDAARSDFCCEKGRERKGGWRVKRA